MSVECGYLEEKIGIYLERGVHVERSYKFVIAFCLVLLFLLVLGMFTMNATLNLSKELGHASKAYSSSAQKVREG